VSAFLAELVNLRDTFAMLEDATILPALTRMLVVADLKLVWVDDLPFYSWQRDSQESAATFLKMYDASFGRHRVSVRFGEGELRKDLEAFANGRPMTDTLAIELLSYQWCKIDDTRAETSHRDVSRVGQVTQHVTEASSRCESKVCHEFFASACAWGREAAGWSWRCCVNVIVINLCFTCNAGHARIPERSQFRCLYRLCL
jgi:hypothetical protein